MNATGDIEWAKRLRAQLTIDILTLRARAREGSGHAEELGMLPDGDRLSDLYRRLEQVDRLVGALEDANTETESSWPIDLGDPGSIDLPEPNRRGH